MIINYDAAIIGGGVIGCAVARELAKYNLKIALFEKEPDVASGISKANSGVIHAGFNVKSGSLKAKFNIEGLKYFPDICSKLNVPYKLCKKLVVANNNEELAYLKKLYEQGIKNRCAGLSIIKKNQIKKLEPNIKGEYALFSENTAIISPYLFTIALAENALDNGVNFYLNHEVINIKRSTADSFLIYFKNNNTYKSKVIINAAGLFSDIIASMVKKNNNKIFPCKGEYYILDTEASSLLNMAVYPVPPLDGSGLGVHLTPTVNGNILIGPSADYINNRNDLSNTKPVMDQLKKEAYQLMPVLKNFSFIKNFSGIRPKLFNSQKKTNFEDFIIEESISGFINLIGIESPGLTSSLAIAKYVVRSLAADKLKLNYKNNFTSLRKGIIKTNLLKPAEINKLYNKDKNSGEIICRCNQITKRELLQAINNPLKAITLDSIKRRTHMMMGRCQGGFCLPKITDILINETGIDPGQILKNSLKSKLFSGYKD